MDCYHVQHDGGIGKKTVNDKISDGSRIEVLKFGVSWQEVQQMSLNDFFMISTQVDRVKNAKQWNVRASLLSLLKGVVIREVLQYSFGKGLTAK